MSKIIIYDNKNFLIAELEGKVEKETALELASKHLEKNTYTARFSTFKLISSISLKNQLRKIEKIFKYHKEKENVKKNL